MMQSGNRFLLKNHEPGRNQPCLCGSGLKFKRCCADEYSSSTLKKCLESFNAGEYKDALIYARRHFTWYVLAYRAHTIPLLEANHEQSQSLLQLDVDALSDLLGYLYSGYRRCGIGDEFLFVIDRVRDSIEHERWDSKIAYHKGLWHLVEKDDSSAAFKTIEKIDILNCEDVDLLTLYLDVKQKRLPREQVMTILATITGNTKDPAIRLQYRCLKAITYFLYLEDDEGEEELREAIKEYESLDESKKSEYGTYMLARACETLGSAVQDTEALGLGEKAVRKLIDESEKNSRGDKHLLSLFNLYGDILNSYQRFEEAEDYYNRSLAVEESGIVQVFRARSVVSLGELDRAREILLQVDELSLTVENKFDMALSWALLALNSLSESDLGVAVEKIKQVETNDPLFIHLRDTQLIKLLEARPRAPLSNIKSSLVKLNKYISLKPNIFGLGIDFNRIIEDHSIRFDRDE